MSCPERERGMHGTRCLNQIAFFQCIRARLIGLCFLCAVSSILAKILPKNGCLVQLWDNSDFAILGPLRADARLTIAELAQRVGLSAAPCWRGVGALGEGGFIRGYHADIDRHK